MKTVILAFTLLGLVSQVQASECSYKEVTELKKVYVVPLYKADVTYAFNKKDAKGFAQIRWGIDEAATKECFKSGKTKYPDSKMVIPTVRVDTLSIRVLGSDSLSNLEVMPLANGHWSGFTTIKIPMSARAEVLKAKENGDQIISTDKDLNYRLTKVTRNYVGSIECTKKEEEAGVLNLFKRLGEVKQEIEARDPEEKLNTEEVLQNFFGVCVEFNNVEADSFAEFESKQRLNSKIVKGKLDLIGNVKVESVESMPAVSIENVSILDI